MGLYVNGLSPGSNIKPLERQSRQTDVEKVRLQQELVNERKKTERNEEEKVVAEKKRVDMSEFVMSEMDMRELLLLMGSRGSSKTVERLVEITKREKETISRLG